MGVIWSRFSVCSLADAFWTSMELGIWKWEDSDSSVESTLVAIKAWATFSKSEFVKNGLNLATVVTWTLHPSLQHLSDCQILVRNSQGRNRVFSKKSLVINKKKKLKSLVFLKANGLLWFSYFIVYLISNQLLLHPLERTLLKYYCR